MPPPASVRMLPSPRPPGPAASGALLLDRRLEQSWAERLPARLGTGVLWLGCVSLFGPVKLTGLLLAGTLMSSTLLLVDRHQRQRQPQPTPVAARGLVLPAGPGRATIADAMGMDESQLFRARHARICTVHLDEEGRITRIALPCPMPLKPRKERDAHPVG